MAPADFYDPVYRAVYEAMQRLYESRRPIDFVTLGEELQAEKKVQQLGGAAFLADLGTKVPTSSHAQRYAEIVKEHSLKRRLIAVGEHTAAHGRDKDLSAAEAVEEAERALLALSQQHSRSSHARLGELLMQRYDDYCEYEASGPPDGVATGFAKLDRMIGGMLPGELHVLAARPSMGKTALLLDIAQHAAAAGKQVTMISLEMSREQIADRIMAGLARHRNLETSQGPVDGAGSQGDGAGD